MSAQQRAPISRYGLRANAHATEVVARVEQALRAASPKTDLEVTATPTRGYHGNSLTTLTSTVVGAAAGKALLRHFADARLLALLWSRLTEQVDDRCQVRLRLDKQAAYGGRLEPGLRGDDVLLTLQLTSYPAHRDRAITALDTFLRQQPWAGPPPL